MADIAKLQVELDASKANASIDSLGRGLKTVGSTVTTFSAAAFSAFDKIITQLRNAALVTGAFSGASVKMFGDLDQHIRETAALMDNVTGSQIRDMRVAVEDLTIKYNQTGEAASKALFDITSAGFGGAAGMKVLEESARLAVAGVTSVKNTADLLTSALNAYSLSADHAGAVSDIMFQTQKLGKTTIEELSGALGRVMPTARLAGVSLQELGASLAALTISGVNTNEATTSLNALLMGLSAPTHEAKAAMRELGLSFKDSHGQLLPLVDIVEKFKGMDLEIMNKIIPEREAVRAIGSLSASIDKLKEFTGAIQDAGGSTQKGFEVISDSVKFKLGSIGESLKTLATRFGSAITESAAFQSALEFSGRSIKDIIEFFNNNSLMVQRNVNLLAERSLSFFESLTELTGFFVSRVMDGIAVIALLAKNLIDLDSFFQDKLVSGKSMFMEMQNSTLKRLQDEKAALDEQKNQIQALVGQVYDRRFVGGGSQEEYVNDMKAVAQMTETWKFNFDAVNNSIKFQTDLLKSGNAELDEMREKSNALSGMSGDTDKFIADMVAGGIAIENRMDSLKLKIAGINDDLKGKIALQEQENALLEKQFTILDKNKLRETILGSMRNEISAPQDEAVAPDQARRELADPSLLVKLREELEKFYIDSRKAYQDIFGTDVQKVVSAFDSEEPKIKKIRELLSGLPDGQHEDLRGSFEAAQKLRSETLDEAIRQSKDKLNLDVLGGRQKNIREEEALEHLQNARRRDELIKRGAHEVDVTRDFEFQKALTRRKFNNDLSAEETILLENGITDQARAHIEMLSRDNLTHKTRLELSAKYREFEKENNNFIMLSEEEKFSRINELDKNAMIGRLADKNLDINQRIEAEAALRNFVEQNSLEYTEYEKGKIEELTDANTLALSQRADAANLSIAERTQAMELLKSRELDALQSMQLGWRLYNAQAQTMTMQMVNFSVGAFKSIENSLAGAFVGMINRTSSFADSVKSFFSSILQSFIQMVAQMTARWLIFDAIKAGAGFLGFSSGGMIPEDGLFGGQAGEAVLTRNAVGILGREGISALNLGKTGGLFGPAQASTQELISRGLSPDTITASLSSNANPSFFTTATSWFKETFPGFQQAGAGLASFGGGMAANLINSALFTPSFESSLGGMMGSAAGSALAAMAFGPWGIFAGALLGGGIGSIFGGERLNADERGVGQAFASYQSQNQFGGDPASEFFQDMALARMDFPDAGADSVHDAFKEIADRMINEEDVDSGTRYGLRSIVDKGFMTEADVNARLVKDLAIFRGAFADGGIVRDRGLALVAERGAEAIIPLQGGAVPVRIGGEISGLLASIDARLARVEERGKDDEKEVVLNIDGEAFIRFLLKHSKAGFDTIHVRGLAGA